MRRKEASYHFLEISLDRPASLKTNSWAKRLGVVFLSLSPSRKISTTSFALKQRLNGLNKKLLSLEALSPWILFHGRISSPLTANHFFSEGGIAPFSQKQFAQVPNFSPGRILRRHRQSSWVQEGWPWLGHASSSFEQLGHKTHLSLIHI